MSDAAIKVGVVGAGGRMGRTVCEAVHLDLQETIALKFLLPAAVEQKETIERFLREARAARKLRSEHVVKVIDVGRLSDSGLPYMAMELLVGRPLSAALSMSGALPLGFGGSAAAGVFCPLRSRRSWASAMVRSARHSKTRKSRRPSRASSTAGSMRSPE